MLKYACLSLALLCLGCQDVKDGKADSEPNKACLDSIPAAVTIPQGSFVMGSARAYSEEAPTRNITVKAFDISATEVTNSQFQTFVNATDYVTDAEKTQKGFGVPGAAVFKMPTADDPTWWQFVEGASWRHPEGPDSNITGRDLYPVVQLTLKDAKAYAKWAGQRLPTEAEWEYAAKAGGDTLYIWGEQRAPEGKERANTWQGAFPLHNTAEDGYGRHAPIGCFEPNDFGLYDTIGNVWEWTDTPWDTHESSGSYVIKGGSFLCAENYCRRYRASARQPQEVDFATNHIGFRTVVNLPRDTNGKF